MKYIYLCFSLLLIFSSAHCAPSLNISAYGGEIPHHLIEKFQKQTGIQVHLSTFESNENLFLKLKSSADPIYDLITPSNYYVHRFILFRMLEPLDIKTIPNTKNINPFFLNPKSKPIYGIPFLWGATGIFYNTNYVKFPPNHWKDLWEKRFENQLLLLDDTREVFSVSLLSLGLNPNTFHIEDLKLAYLQLQKLANNIKLFASDAMPSIIINEDAPAGIAWNGDVIKAQLENSAIQFVLPSEGFIIWAECFAIPRGAKNKENAIKFINFVLEPKNAAEITKIMKFPVTIDKAKQFLPPNLATQPFLFLAPEILKRGILQQDAPENIIKTYNSYWELFKISL